MLQATKRTVKYFSQVFFYILMSFILLMLLLQIAPVQSSILNKYLKKIEDKTTYKISVQKGNFSWFDRISLEDLLILDLKKDTLLYARDVVFNYDLWDLVNSNKLKLEEIQSSYMKIKIRKYIKDTGMNLFDFLGKIKGERRDRKESSFSLKGINIAEMDLILDDYTKEEKSKGLDIFHTKLNLFDLIVSDFSIDNDLIDFQIQQIRGKELKTGLEITDFQTHFKLDKYSMHFSKLNLKTPNSELTDDFLLTYEDTKNLYQFKDSVQFNFNFKKSHLSKQDIEKILGHNLVKSDLKMDGNISGGLSDINMKDVTFSFGKKSFFKGTASITGLPNIQETFIIADVQYSKLNSDDLKPYIGKLAHNVSQLGEIDFSGNYYGFVSDFVTRGSFTTPKGSITVDLNIKIPKKNYKEMSYVGNIKVADFHLGFFLKDTINFQKINLKGRIKGQGITKNNANFDLDALLNKFSIKNYIYDSLKIDGKFSSNFFRGNFNIKDPNCKLKGYLNLDNNDKVFYVDVQLDTTYLDRINILEKPLLVKSDISINLKNLDIDNFTGTILFKNFYLQQNEKYLNIDSLQFISEKLKDERRLNFQIPGMKMEVSGNFLIQDVVREFPLLASYYTNKFLLAPSKFDSLQSAETGRYHLDYNIQIDSINEYFNTFEIPLEISNGSSMEGSFSKRNNEIFDLYAHFDSLKYRGMEFYKVLVDINSIKDLFGEGLLASLIIHSNKQKYKKIETNDLVIEGVWENDSLDFLVGLGHQKTQSNLNIRSSVEFTPDEIFCHFDYSYLEIFDEKWLFKPDAKIVYKKQSIEFQNMEISSREETIGIKGKYTKSEDTDLHVFAQNLAVNKLDIILPDHNMRGTIDLKSNFKKDTQSFVEGDYSIRNLYYDSIYVGDFVGFFLWNSDKGSLLNNMEMYQEGNTAIQVKGSVYPFAENNNFDLHVKFRKFRIHYFEKLVAHRLSNLEADIFGDLFISNSFKEPHVKGMLELEKGKFKYNYLNTEYTFQGKASILTDEIFFYDFKLFDRKQGKCKVAGSIQHNRFQKLDLDLALSVENFELLNTTQEHNDKYYGSAYASGKVVVGGSYRDANIYANITTEPETNIMIPFSKQSKVSLEDFIYFRRPEKQEDQKIKTANSENANSYSLELDIDVTTNALIRFIYDMKTGDEVLGRSNGNVKLISNSNDELHLFGELHIDEGEYDFTIMDVINKRFTIQNGSKISWYGDPYKAAFQMKLSYIQRASFEALNELALQDKSKLAVKIPLQVVIQLSGEVLRPLIEFDIKFNDGLNVTEENRVKLAQIRNDEQELKRQLISLLFFKKFSPQSSFEVSGNVGSSLGSFFSNQLSQLIGQLDENLEIDINLASLSDDKFDQFQLRLGYTFLDGRLRVIRDGVIVNNDVNSNRDMVNNIIGNFSVEYSLLKSGKLRLKFYRDYTRRLTYQNDGQVEVGFSVRMAHSFNRFKDILNLKRKEALTRKKKEKKFEKNR